MENELNKKTEAVVAMGNLVKTERTRYQDLLNNFQKLEAAYQASKSNISPSSLKKDLVQFFFFQNFILSQV